ncbi:hypothetical protein [Nocardia sp. NPDC049707]
MEVVVAFNQADDIGAGVLIQRRHTTVTEDGVPVVTAEKPTDMGSP